MRVSPTARHAATLVVLLLGLAVLPEGVARADHLRVENGIQFKSVTAERVNTDAGPKWRVSVRVESPCQPCTRIELLLTYRFIGTNGQWVDSSTSASTSPMGGTFEFPLFNGAATEFRIFAREFLYFPAVFHAVFVTGYYPDCEGGDQVCDYAELE